MEINMMNEFMKSILTNEEMLNRKRGCEVLPVVKTEQTTCPKIKVADGLPDELTDVIKSLFGSKFDKSLVYTTPIADLEDEFDNYHCDKPKQTSLKEAENVFTTEASKPDLSIDDEAEDDCNEWYAYCIFESERERAYALGQKDVAEAFDFASEVILRLIGRDTKWLVRKVDELD